MRSRVRPMVCHRPSRVRSAALRSAALNLAKACSIGLPRRVGQRPHPADVGGVHVAHRRDQRRPLGPRQRRRPGAVPRQQDGDRLQPPPQGRELRDDRLHPGLLDQVERDPRDHSCVNAVTSYLDKIEANTTGARVEVSRVDRPASASTSTRRTARSSSRRRATPPKAAALNGAFAVQAAAALRERSPSRRRRTAASTSR